MWKEIFQFLTETNIYIDKMAPWNLKKNDIKRMNIVLSVSVELIKRATFMLYPIIPSSCIKIFKIINVNHESLLFENVLNKPIESININISKPIFPRLDIK